MRRLATATLPLPIVFALLFAPLQTLSDTAYACSCIQTTVAERVKGADVVAIGTVISVYEDAETVDSRDGAVDIPDTDAVFAINTYFGGTGPAEIAVDDPPDGGTCGFVSSDSVGREAVLFLELSEGEYLTHICVGSGFFGDEDFRAETIAAIEAVTGPGHAPEYPVLGWLPPEQEYTEDTPWAVVLPLAFAIPLAVLVVPALLRRRGGH